MTIQKKLIYSLVLLSVLLLLANIIFEISAHVEAEPISEMSIKEIEKKVKEILADRLDKMPEFLDLIKTKL